MEKQFRCDDPLNTLVRVLDVARRLNLTFDTLRMDRHETGQHTLCFSLLDPESEGARLFIERIVLLYDLIAGDTHV